MSTILNQIRNFFFLLVLATVMSCTAEHVTVKPEEPVIVKPAAPGAGYVYREGEWKYDGVKKVYVYDPGVWVTHTGVWVPGHWNTVKGGYRWVPGHWK